MDCPQKLDTQLSKVQFFLAKPKYSLETRLAVVNHFPLPLMPAIQCCSAT